jgi:hypothetical protein
MAPRTVFAKVGVSTAGSFGDPFLDAGHKSTPA